MNRAALRRRRAIRYADRDPPDRVPTVKRVAAVALTLACSKAHVDDRADVSAEASGAITRADSAAESVDAAGADDAEAQPEAGAAEAGATTVTRWRIAYERMGESGFVQGSRTSAVLSDDGSFKTSTFSTHATPAQVYAARALLLGMREHGQLSASKPPDPAAACSVCAHTDMRVTMDGVASFVDLTATDPADPPRTLSIGHIVVWNNQRAVRLETLIESIGPEREGRVTVTGNLSSDVVKRIVRENARRRPCYEDAARPGLAGTVTVSFIIDHSGSVSSAVQDPASTATDIADPALVECAVRAFGSLSFPAPDAGTVTVVYQTVFTP